MIALMRQVADAGTSEGGRWAGMRVHMVRNRIMTELGYSSKLNAEWAFLAPRGRFLSRARVRQSRKMLFCGPRPVAGGILNLSNWT